jgi:hypothetical protein
MGQKAHGIDRPSREIEKEKPPCRVEIGAAAFFMTIS